MWHCCAEQHIIRVGNVNRCVEYHSKQEFKRPWWQNGHVGSASKKKHKSTVCLGRSTLHHTYRTCFASNRQRHWCEVLVRLCLVSFGKQERVIVKKTRELAASCRSVWRPSTPQRKSVATHSGALWRGRTWTCPLNPERIIHQIHDVFLPQVSEEIT